MASLLRLTEILITTYFFCSEICNFFAFQSVELSPNFVFLPRFYFLFESGHLSIGCESVTANWTTNLEIFHQYEVNGMCCTTREKVV